LQQLNILSRKQSKYCRKLTRLNNITYASSSSSIYFIKEHITKKKTKNQDNKMVQLNSSRNLFTLKS